MKVIQDALLYTKIRLSVTVKEYKEVPLSLRGRTHSSAICYSEYRMLGREPKQDWILWQRSGTDCTTMHDVNIERAHPWPRAMVFLRSGGNGILRFHWPSEVAGSDPSWWTSLPPEAYPVNMELPRRHFWGKRGGFETSQGMLPTTISTATPAAILNLTMPCQQAWLVHQIQRDLGEG